MAASDALPIPRKNVAYRVTFPILDADGDLVTGATGLDSEVSKDAGTFTDCTNEATEIATSSGIYYLDLTSTEMNADCVAIIVKTSSSGAKTTVITLYPEEAGDTRCDVVWFGGVAGTFSGGRPEVNTTHAAGTAWNSGAIGAATIANDTIDAATFAADVDAEVRGWLGLASGNLDTQLADLPTVAEFDARTLLAADYLVTSDLAGLALEATSQLILGDTSELQTDWVDGGRLDLILDGVAAASAPSAAAIADAVWDELQTDHVAAGSFGEIASEIALILADTNELQTDWTDGGRLDLLLDSAGDPWSIPLPGAYAIGEAGYILGTYLDVAVSSRLEETAEVAEVISTATSSSVIRICNIALSLIGEPSITSMADSSKTARMCDLRFSDVLDSVLRAHPWSSAMKRTSLAALEAAPAYGYTYQFQLPSDFLRFVEAETPSADFKFEGQTILANQTPFKMVYIHRPTSVATLDELLRQTVAARLAYELCVSISRNSERAQMLWAMYEKKLAEARFVDASHTAGKTIRTETWLEERLGDGGVYRPIG